MSTKKQLVKEVFQKARKECDKGTKNGLSEYLAVKLEEEVNLRISERTLIRYYDTYVLDHTGRAEIEIDSQTLDKFSQYLGYSCFEHFMNPNEFILESVNTAYIHRPLTFIPDHSKIADGGLHINIHNIIRLPDFIKNNKAMSLGVVGLFLAGGSVVHFTGYLQKKDRMYWNGTEYRLTSETDKNPNHTVIPLDTVQFKYFRKITRPDTLQVQNAMNRVWYSKYQNKVDFFTMDGTNPNNDKELKPVSEVILAKYAGGNKPEDQ